MRKSWLVALALGLGWIGSTTAFGQYPNAYNNFGPSSYPVAQQPQMPSVLQNLPQVPPQYQQSSPYQLTAAQDHSGAAYGSGANYGVPSNVGGQQSIPPVPMAPPAPAVYGQQPYAEQSIQPSVGMSAPGCTTCQTAPVQQYQAPVDHGYAQSVAPNCSGYGAAPTYTAAPSYFGGNAYAGNSQIFGNHIGGGALAGVGGLPCGAKPWFFGGGVLLFNRIDNHNVPLSFRDSDYGPDVLGTQDARMGISPGFEVMMGRYFNGGKNAIQASYWGVFPDTEDRRVYANMPEGLQSRISFQYLDVPGHTGMPTTYPAADYYNDGWVHCLKRSSEFHNVEVNLLGFAVGCASRNFNMSTAGTMFSGTRGGCGYCGGAGCGSCCGGGSSCAPSKFATGPCCLIAPACGSRLNMSWLAGFRYFRFEDNLEYSASMNDGALTGGPDDLYYTVNTTNDLFGFQLGSRADYCLGRRVNLYGTGKVGIYNNHSTMFTNLATSDTAAVLNDTRTITNPDNGMEYSFDEMRDSVAFLSELGTGVGVRLSPKWTATCGYRAVIVNGVATSPDNIRQSFANFNDVRDYDSSGCLVLHGVNIGALYNY